MLLEEPNQVFAGDTTILRSWDAVTAQASGIEPLANGPWGDFTDLSYLSSSKDRLHSGLSNDILAMHCGGIAGPPELHPCHAGRLS